MLSIFSPLFTKPTPVLAFKPIRRSRPPPIPSRTTVDVWEYLGDGIWGSMGQAFPEVNTDPFWLMLIRVTPWWP